MKDFPDCAGIAMRESNYIGTVVQKRQQECGCRICSGTITRVQSHQAPVSEAAPFSVALSTSSDRKFFSRLKGLRAIATRHGQCGEPFLSAICIAATGIVWSQVLTSGSGEAQAAFGINGGVPDVSQGF